MDKIFKIFLHRLKLGGVDFLLTAVFETLSEYRRTKAKHHFDLFNEVNTSEQNKEMSDNEKEGFFSKLFGKRRKDDDFNQYDNAK